MGYLDSEIENFLKLFPVVKEVAKLPDLEGDIVSSDGEEIRKLLEKRLRALVIAYKVVRELRKFL